MNYTDPETIPPVWQIGYVILDRYEVQQIFTNGGMGLVYRADHRGWGMALAVKSPRPEFLQTAEQIESFEREAETWVNLGLHPAHRQLLLRPPPRRHPAHLRGVCGRRRTRSAAESCQPHD